MSNTELCTFIKDLCRELRKIEVEFVDCSSCSVDVYKELCITSWKLQDLLIYLSYQIK